MINKQKILEGIHLIAYVRDKQTKLYSTIEDSSYNTKTSFKKDLEANGYDNISILDNRDMFLIDNTNYMRVSQLKNELKKRGLFSQYREGFARRSLSHLVYEAFSGRKWKGFYILFRNLLMINDPTVCQVFIQKAFRYLCKRFARACH